MSGKVPTWFRSLAAAGCTSCILCILCWDPWLRPFRPAAVDLFFLWEWGMSRVATGRWVADRNIHERSIYHFYLFLKGCCHWYFQGNPKESANQLGETFLKVIAKSFDVSAIQMTPAFKRCQRHALAFARSSFFGICWLARPEPTAVNFWACKPERRGSVSISILGLKLSAVIWHLHYVPVAKPAMEGAS